MIPVRTFASSDEDSVLIEDSDIPLRLWYDEEAPYNNENAEDHTGITADDGWERWSLPIGNGYFGANVFGRTETERIQITEKTLSNPYTKTGPDGEKYSLGGLNNFSETYIDVGHPFAEVTDYERWLDIKTAISGVKYGYNGVTYTREYFTSYPDKALVIRLDSSEAGKLDFILRPTVPWEQEYAAWEGDGASKTGEVISYLDGSDGVIELSGKMGYFDIDFLGIYRVVTNGGTVSVTTCTNADGDTDGTITVSGATSAYIYITLGTDYELSSEMFTAAESEKPTFDTTLEDTRVKVEAEADAIAQKLAGKSFEESYDILKQCHLSDYCELFDRVTLTLGDEEDASLTTDELLAKYKSGDYSNYLNALYFQYGRYLLIASSRQGTLPANLQGVWNRYNKSPWGSGIWHNINVQMNYWPAFSTNLAETFEAYVGYNSAFREKAEANATSVISKYNSSVLDEDGGNGWCIGVGSFPYSVASDRSAGNLGFTTQLYWDWYEYTKDATILTDVYETLVSAARFITKCVELDESGYYLVSHCDSPEMHVNGVWYYTVGTTYAQTFAYLNNYNALLAAKEIGIDITDTELLSTEEYSILSTVLEQIDKYDPINVGLSGQIKEFREEDYYASVADDPHHRHISQLVGLYPGNLINGTTPAWLDAAKVTLTERGDNATGWGIAHRMNLWARVKDGQRAYELYSLLLTKGTATNLWDLHPPFQIDGNLGGTAGVSEMLLQSHEGYIAPLAAIPDAWSNGSYTGLVARGGFEVSAAWENGLAKTFNIKSTVGGDASVSYGGITEARVVRASDGKEVDYTVSGTDLITFATEADETYIISGFKSYVKLSAPENFVASREGLGDITLTWDAVDGAVGYNVYIAIENQADYTLLGFTEGVSAVYSPEFENINARTTIKVIPVSTEGKEGEGAIDYVNPIDLNSYVYSYAAFAFDNGELQVTVNASENTVKYKLWKMASGDSDYTLIAESPYPIIVYDSYVESDKYAVSLISNALDTESELYELEVRPEGAGAADGAKWYTNILSGREFSAAEGTSIHSSGYGYDKLTDGIYDKDADGNKNIHLGRFSTKDVENAILDGTVTFEGAYLLSEMRIYDYGGSTSTRLGNEISVYAFYAGEWREVYSISGEENIVAAKLKDTEQSLTYLPIDISGVKAEAIRVYALNSSDTSAITLYEITCSGASIATDTEYSDNILLEKQPTEYTTTTNVITNYGIEHLTDGNFNSNAGRFATVSGENSSVTLVYEFDDECVLDTLRVYDFVESSEKVSRVSSAVVELYQNGEWVKYRDGEALLSPSARVSGARGMHTPISLEGAKASKIRITLTNTESTLGITLYEIELSGWRKAVVEPQNENILDGKEFVAAEGASVWGSDYGYDKLTDGNYGKDSSGNTNSQLGRYSSAGGDEVFLDGTVTLGGVYLLSEMRIYDFGGSTGTRLGSEISVYAFYAGEWREVYSISGEENIVAAKLKDTEHSLTYLPIDLSGVKAEAIRVYALNSSDTRAITLYEITCSGTKLFEVTDKNIISDSVSVTVGSESYVDMVLNENILTGNTFVQNSGASEQHSSGYGYSKLTDGIYDKDADGNKSIHLGRFATKSVENAIFDGTVTLDGTYLLSELRIYDYVGETYTRIGNSITVYVLSGEQWFEAVSISGSSNVVSSKKYDEALALYYVPIDLSGIAAEAIRVYTVDTVRTDGITFYEITCSGAKLSDAQETETTTSSLDEDQISALTDKSSDTYFAAEVGTLSYYLEFDLGRSYSLYTLNIRDVRYVSDLINGELATRSNENYVELYVNGEWIKVVNGEPLTTDEEFTSFELYGFTATKLRIRFNNTEIFDNGASPLAVISEIYCTVSADAADKKPMLEAYKKLAELNSTDAEHLAKMEIFKGYLTAVTLTEEGVEASITEMNDYFSEFLSNAVSNVGFTPKTSVTLGSELSINIYIPQKSLLKFTLNDVEYADLEALSDILVELDGEYYYRISKPLAASEAASEFKLTVCIDSGENILNGSFTISIPKYAKKVIESGGTEEEVNLVKDVLSYIRAAYAYFDKVDEEQIAKIDELLGENYDANNAPALSGSAEEPSEGLISATYILNATPTIRFYITGDAASYAFYDVNGAKLNTVVGTDEKGTYLEMDVYAYAMGETITYTINGVESGSYHINCYYTFVTTNEAYKDNAELINLVARFAKYCESAAAYRNSVLENS